MRPDLEVRAAGGGQVQATGADRWRLSLPPGDASGYRLAQLDDYSRLRARRAFAHRPPLRLSLEARVSASDLTGTWGFGFWNDPFGFSLTVRGSGRRLPALPDAAWFFYASPSNHLAFRDDHPAQGFLAATFSSRPVLPALLALGAPLATGLVLRPTARLLRRLGRTVISEDAALVNADPTEWHGYALTWLPDRVLFCVDGSPVFETPVSPRGPLGLVLWIDNQYARFTPAGHVGFGSLRTPQEAYLDLAGVEARAVSA